MQIEKECEPYLKSSEVINIIQSGNETFKSKVFNCINKHKHLICSNIILKHRLIETDILNMCSESAFQDAQIIFLKKVELNLFSPDHETCIPYLKGVFKKKYFGEYRKELNRKVALKDVGNSITDHDWEENKKDLSDTIKAAVSALSTQEQQIYKLYYEEGFRLKEIAEILHLQYQTIREKASKICRDISNNWKFN